MDLVFPCAKNVDFFFLMVYFIKMLDLWLKQM